MATKAKKSTAMMVAPTEDQLAELGGAVEQEPGFERLHLPRIGFAGKDKVEVIGTGKNKKINVLMAAGTYFFERETEEVTTKADGTEGKVWEKEEVDEDTPIEGILVFKRKQLRYFDEDDGENGKYTSSSIFGGEEGEDPKVDIISLFKDGKKVESGTVDELQAKYPHKLSKKGKKIPQLAIESICYVLVDGVLYQMNIKGSSLWALRDYTKKIKAATVITRFESKANEVGDNKFNSMTFTPVRALTAEEAALAIDTLRMIRKGVNDEKAYFAGQNQESEVDKEFEALTAGEKKDKPF